MSSPRLATADDVAAMVSFLERHVDTSLFLLDNLRERGLDAEGVTYAIQRDHDAVAAVASVSHTGMLLLQAPDDAVPLAAFAVRTRKKALHGLLGPTEQIAPVLAASDFGSRAARLHSDERLYARDLRAFTPPAAPARSQVRLALPSDVDALTFFRRAYLVEALGAPDDDASSQAARAEAAQMCGDGVTFLLVERDVILATTRFTARHRDIVQVGGVYTPRDLRSRGYARAVVAGSLDLARVRWGATRAVLFTAEGNAPAQRAYEALGFERAGGYTLHFFNEAIELDSIAP